MILAALASSWLAGCEQFARVGSAPEDGPPSQGDSGSDAGDATDAGEGADASADAGALDAEGPKPKEDGSTTPDGASASCSPEIDGCNPVANTGCFPDLAQQCGPNLTASTLSGYCTFHGDVPDGGLGCVNTVATESCPPTTTCVSGECREVCFCDADCTEGCCSEPLGDKGFRLCAPC